jgi:tellurium resistance protein TerD
MPVTLNKGENVSLSREDPGLTNILVGLGWTVRETDGDDFDLDTSGFMLDVDGKVQNDGDFVFYNNLVSPCGSLTHSGDNLSGNEGANADAETLKLNLGTLSPETERIAICVSIHQAEIRQQNFGMVSGAYIRIVNERSKQEIARFDLSEDASVETAMIFGEIYRYGGEWKFRATAQGFPGGLGELARHFGVNVE